MPDSPETIVQASVDAYNSQNAEAYIQCFLPSATFGQLGGRVLLDSHEAIKSFYASQFKERPSIRCNVKQRTAMGSYVIDLQEISGEGMPAMEAMLIHEIREGLIAKIWYAPIAGGPAGRH